MERSFGLFTADTNRKQEKPSGLSNLVKGSARALSWPAPAPTPVFGGRTEDTITQVINTRLPRDTYKEAERLLFHRPPDEQSPITIFRHPRKPNRDLFVGNGRGNHVRPTLEHPLSLTDTPRIPNTYDYDALENMPEFDSRWVTDQPLEAIKGIFAPLRGIFAPLRVPGDEEVEEATRHFAKVEAL